MAEAVEGPARERGGVCARDHGLVAAGLLAGRHAYNDPREALGAPDAVKLGGKDDYRGFMSLGQGGYVVVDMGERFLDRPGDDVRVYQTTTGEPITRHASDAARLPLHSTAAGGVTAASPLAAACPRATATSTLREAGLAGVRYLKIEDGEIYPCRSAGFVQRGLGYPRGQWLGP